MGKSVYVSPSTQENNVGAGSYGTEEKRMNQVGDVVVRELTRHSVTVYRNKPEMSLGQVVDDSNAKAPTLHFAIHSNASGRPGGGVRGGEVFCHKFGGTGEQMARNVYAELEPLTPTSDRGVQEGANAYGPGKPMYELAYTDAPAALVEIDFHDDAGGAAWIIEHIEVIGVALTKGLLKTLSIAWQPLPVEQPQPVGVAILGKPTATAAQAKEWARKNGATTQFIKNIDSYYSMAPACGGVNPVGAIAQSAKETNKGKYGGIVKVEQCNPCGLKITNPKAETAADHATFNNWDMGIAAHMDHLALYAGAPDYPKTGSPDPRHFASIKGIARTWEALGGKYAPSGTYGAEIVAMMKEIAATPEPKVKTPQEITIDNAIADSAVTDLDYWNKVLAGKESANPQYLKQAFDNYHNQLVKAKGGK